MNAGRVRVWDLPTRLGHWLLVAAFITAELTSDSEKWRNVHVKAGFVMLAVVAFRIVWGIAGSRHALWSALTLAPNRVSEYAGSLLRGRPVHYTGHNPLGSIAILLLLTLILATGISGVITYEDWGSFRHMDRYHERAASILLWLVGIHLAGVFVSSLLHRENLFWGIVSGSKQGDPTEAIDKATGRVGTWMLLALVAAATMLS